MAFGKPSYLARCLPDGAFFAVRVLLASFWFGIFIWRQTSATTCINDLNTTVGCDGETVYDGEWWAYLTNWTLTFELIYLVIVAYATGMALYSSLPDGRGKATPWFVSVSWAMQGTALLMSFLVFVLYWVLDYDPSNDVIDFANIAVHGLNTVVMIVDFAICSQPFHLAHIYMPFTYAVAYLVFNVVYWRVTGTATYAVLDWSNASAAGRIAGIVVLVVVPLFWVICYFLFLWRRCCSLPAEQQQALDRKTPTNHPTIELPASQSV